MVPPTSIGSSGAMVTAHSACPHGRTAPAPHSDLVPQASTQGSTPWRWVLLLPACMRSRHLSLEAHVLQLGDPGQECSHRRQARASLPLQLRGVRTPLAVQLPNAGSLDPCSFTCRCRAETLVQHVLPRDPLKAKPRRWSFFTCAALMRKPHAGWRPALLRPSSTAYARSLHMSGFTLHCHRRQDSALRFSRLQTRPPPRPPHDRTMVARRSCGCCRSRLHPNGGCGGSAADRACVRVSGPAKSLRPAASARPCEWWADDARACPGPRISAPWAALAKRRVHLCTHTRTRKKPGRKKKTENTKIEK